MTQAAEAETETGDRILLGERYRIHPERALPELDSPTAKAYAVTDLRAATRMLFALVCAPNLAPRVEIIPALARLARQPVVVPLEAGTVFWPEADGLRFVIVFEHDFDERVLHGPDATIEPLREDALVRTVIKPLLPVLKDLGGRMIAHRAIRADNLFYQDASRSAVVLGECVSAPPALSQPALYEPIDSAMCLPSGRGAGSPTDDLYAFGATLVVLLHGGWPVAGMSDEEIVEAKIAKGSYAALVGQMRISLALMEPLRGLLSDDPTERWSVSDLELWAGGRHLSPKQPKLPPRASRAIAFAGGEYWTRPALSHALGRHWGEATGFVVENELEAWTRRALGDEDAADGIAAMKEAGGSSGPSRDRLVSRILMAFDPELPLRYRRLASRIEALPQVLAVDYHDAELRKAFVEVMGAKLPQAYLQLRPHPKAEHAALMKMFEMIEHFVERRRMGQGLERALYEANRTWPCQSPLLAGDHVAEPEALLPALERVARRGKTDREPVDAHVAAFCAARMKPFPERILKELDSPEQLVTFRLGVLHLLVELQRLNPRLRVPALSRWMAGLLKPVFESFHNRAYRERLAREVELASGRGDLEHLQFLVDDLDSRTQDEQGFEAARREHAETSRVLAWLEAGGMSSPAFVRAKSNQVGSVLAAAISGLMMVVMTLMYLS